MTIYSIPSLRQPESISPQFYFTSQSFISRAQTDVDNLLNNWVHSIKLIQKHHHQQHQHHQHFNHQKKLGPFLKFKSIYARLGWIYIHLSVVDPALRKHWFNTLIRLFLQNFQDHVDPLRQIGSLFGLWCFWGTQPDSVLGPKHHIVVDPETLNYIHQMPIKYADKLNQSFNDIVDEAFEEISKSATNSQPSHPSPSLSSKHRAHLDPNIFGPPPPTIKPSDSIYQVLKNLTDQDAFVIQPSQIALVYPPLPTNRISSENIQDPQIIELDSNHSHHHHQSRKSKPNPSSSTVIPELIISTKNKLHDWDKKEKYSICDPSELNRLRDLYLSTKSFLVNHPSSSSSSSTAPAPKPEPLPRELFVEAIGMTRKVIQKTGPGLDHLLFPNAPPAPSLATEEERTGDQQQSLDAFFLVDQAQSVPELESLMKA